MEYTADLMPRYTLQSASFLNNTRPVIWLDVEKRKADLEPALTSVHWADGLKTYAHDATLAQSAKARSLEFQPWAQLAAEIVRVAMASDSLIAGYSIPERDLLMESCPEHAEWIKENYLNANAAKWFKNNRPALYRSQQGVRPPYGGLTPCWNYPTRSSPRAGRPAKSRRSLRRRRYS